MSNRIKVVGAVVDAYGVRAEISASAAGFVVECENERRTFVGLAEAFDWACAFLSRFLTAPLRWEGCKSVKGLTFANGTAWVKLGAYWLRPFSLKLLKIK